MSTPNVTGAELRAQFLDYFAGNGHTVVRSGGLVPDDPTLMFTNAGMVPFKDVFTGKDPRGYTRAASVQKCLRVSGKHNDLDEVGRTPRHHTFFEMLGNFSFGDYFKEEAIRLAWKLIIDEWRIDADRLWITVHHTDDEAFDLWTRMIGVPHDRVVRLGDKDNFWSMGDTGPCGPCTEIHYDMGPELGPAHPRGPEGGGNRYMEFWNNVFMQFERHPDGSMDPLPKPSVDTGMGLERIASVVQGVRSNYDTDLLRNLMLDGGDLAGVKLGHDERTDTALRVLADHGRACAFLVSEGIIPANEGRGYVLRRIARRGIRFGLQLGLGGESFLHRITDRVVHHFGEAYPELVERRAFIERVILGEEERFAETRDRGLALLDEELAKGVDELPGEVAFKLHDTYGFPVDLTRLIAAERGVGLDEAAYHAHMEAQREAGRAAWKGSGAEGLDETYAALAAQGQSTEFVGYDTLEARASVTALIRDGHLVEHLEAGQEGELVVGVSPFYAESGGQVGDQGEVTGAGGVRARVTDTQRPTGELVVHHVSVESGTLRVGDDVLLSVQGERRDATRRHHSATHLLNSALRQVLGDHVAQKGSLVDSRRLRFDFSHFEPVTDAELRRIEDIVNDMVLDNQAVSATHMALDDAKSAGAVAMFGEKYGSEVRVIQMGPHSMELCGGTHVDRTGDIGLFWIQSEAGVSAGVRRIEALAGHAAARAARASRETTDALAQRLRVPAPQLDEAVERLQAELKAVRKELEEAKRAEALSDVDSLVAGARDMGGFRMIVARSQGEPGLMRDQADKLRDQLGSGVVVLGNESGGKALLLVAATKDLAGKRVHAGKIVGRLAGMVGGRGGGRPDFGQAGGPDAAQLDAALEAAWGMVAEG